MSEKRVCIEFCVAFKRPRSGALCFRVIVDGTKDGHFPPNAERADILAFEFALMDSFLW